jgi:hypothetical protein
MEKTFLKKRKQKSIGFLKNTIESNNFLRDDYRELADLSLVVLGEKPRENLTFKIYGVCHHARWMMIDEDNLRIQNILTNSLKTKGRSKKPI